MNCIRCKKEIKQNPSCKIEGKSGSGYYDFKGELCGDCYLVIFSLLKYRNLIRN